MELHSRDLDRFWSKVQKTDDCWVWTASLDGCGYGQFAMKSEDGKWRPKKAHRLAYEAVVGPIPDGLEPDHTCGNPACVRPDHLEPVTHQENILRAKRTKPFKCGHPLSPENLIFQKSKKRANVRRCRICYYAHIARARAKS